MTRPEKIKRRLEEKRLSGNRCKNHYDIKYLLSALESAEKVVEAARYIGTEHSGMCVTIACNCTGHAKRRVDLADALAAHAALADAKLKGKGKPVKDEFFCCKDQDNPCHPIRDYCSTGRPREQEKRP